MKPLYLKITADQIMYSNNENTIDENTYSFNSKLQLKQNLQAFRDEFSDTIDVIVITNPVETILKKNIINYQNQPIDFGSELEDVFHLPVINMKDIEASDLATATANENDYATWHLDYYGIDHGKRQYGQESMQTIGNGYFGLRGTYLEAKACDDNYPATYVAGVFNQLATPINGRNVINEDLVNLPNAQFITFSVDGSDYFKIDERYIKEALRSLDLKTGVLTTTLLIRLIDGRELKVIEKKVADLKNYHNYYLQYSIQPLNFSGEIKIVTEIDASVTNSNVERYRNLASKHLVTDKIENNQQEVTLLAHTSQSKIDIAIKTGISYPNITDPIYAMDNLSNIAHQTITFDAQQNQTYNFEKFVTIYTSLETKKPVEQAANEQEFLANFQAAQAQSQQNWQKIWNQEDVVISGDITAQKLLRLNSFSMTNAAQLNANADLDASVGSRGLTGEGYRGHIFWDELFDMNFYILHTPELVKYLLMYRYNRLKAATLRLMVSVEQCSLGKAVCMVMNNPKKFT